MQSDMSRRLNLSPRGGAESSQKREPPLVVDMDGTLIHTDSLVEGALQMWKADPLSAFKCLWWILCGKAALKREIANRVELDAGGLPYNECLVTRLQEQSGTREIVLCTAADHRFAESVAKHVGVFDEVLATNGDVNLRSAAKARALVDRFGVGGFDYAGNDTADLEVFAVARRALVVTPTAGLRRRLGQIANREELAPSRRFAFMDYLHALRPRQWAKNVLVYVPLLATINMARVPWFLPATLATICFCLIASCGYLLNDLSDLAADRRHPRKRFRPTASGRVPLQHVLAMVPMLLVAGFLIASTISVTFTGALLLYLIGTILYTFWLKKVPVLDTIVLAGLYTIRIIAGAAAIQVTPSVWLISFSMFFFLSLALAKRHSELVELEGTEQEGSIPGRKYQSEDLRTLISHGSSSGYAAVLVLALFIDSAMVREQYRHPEIIWFICPLVLYWINKLWLNSVRKQIKDDPVVWAMRNRVSRLIAVLSVALLLTAKWLP
jgi:4-hydroxybenzoate polyprenyltransferase